MKKLRMFLTALLLCAVSAFVITACKNNSDGATGEGDGKSITVSIDRFEKKQLETDLKGTITWSSEDETVVSVSAGGMITALKPGETKVTATADGKSVVYKITVNAGESPKLSPLESGRKEIYVGGTYDLSQEVSVTYKNAPLTEGVTVTYTATNDKISVDEHGVVTGVKTGQASVTVKISYMGWTSLSTQTRLFTVLDSSVISVGNEKVSIYTNAVGSLHNDDLYPQSYTIPAKVIINAQEVPGAVVEAQIESGSDYVTLNGLTVQAKAVGEAVILLTYNRANDDPLTAKVTVKVLDDTVEFDPVKELMKADPENSKNTFGTYDGQNDEFIGSAKLTGVGENYWYNAVKTDNVSGIPDHYKALSYLAYFEGGVQTVVYIPSDNKTGNDKVLFYTVNGKVNSADHPLLHVFSSDGKTCLDGQDLDAATWYLFVVDLTSFTNVNNYTIFGLSLGDCSQGERTAYFKDFKYYLTAREALFPNGTFESNHGSYDPDADQSVTNDKDNFINNITIADPNNTWIQKVVTGEFAGSYKYSSIVEGKDTSCITFNDIIDANKNPQAFFTSGKHYISLDIYLKEGSGFTVCNWVAMGEKTQNKEDIIKVENATLGVGSEVPPTFRLIKDMNGIKRPTKLQKDNWYTLVIEVDYTAQQQSQIDWAFIYLALNGSRFDPGVAYIKNYSCSATKPEILNNLREDIALDDFTADADYVNFVKITDTQHDMYDPDTDVYEYTHESGVFWNARVELAQLCAYNEGKVNSSSDFYTHGNHYVSLKIYASENVTLYTVSMNGPGTAVYDGDDAVRVYDSDNYALAQTPNSGAAALMCDLVGGQWYTVVFPVPYETVPASTETRHFYFATENASQSPVYVKGLSYTKEMPLTPAVPPAPAAIIAGSNVTIEKVEEGPMYVDEDTTVYKYEHDIDSYWAAHVAFYEICELGQGKANAGSDFFKNGNHFITFKIYVDAEEETTFYTASMPNGAWCLSGENVIKVCTYADGTYTALAQTPHGGDGYQTCTLQGKTWYTVLIPVPYDTVPSVNDTYWVYFATEKGTTSYVKEINYSVTAPFVAEEPAPPAPLAVEDESKVTVAEVEEGDDKYEQGTTVYEYSHNEGSYWSARVAFTQICSMENGAANSTSDFFQNGNHFVSFKILASKDDTTLFIASMVDGNFVTEGNNRARVFDANDQNNITALAQVVESSVLKHSLTKDVWYTVIIPVPYTTVPTSTLWIYFATNAGKTAYVKDITYSVTSPIELDEEPSTTPVTEVFFGGEKGDSYVVYVEEDDEMYEENKTTIKYVIDRSDYATRIVFSCVNSEDYTAGEFFTGENEYIKFDIYSEGTSTLRIYSVVNWNAYGTATATYVNDQNETVAVPLSVSGNDYVFSLPEKVWCTVVIHVAATGDTVNTSNTYIRNETAGVALYIRDIEYSVENPNGAGQQDPQGGESNE